MISVIVPKVTFVEIGDALRMIREAKELKQKDVAVAAKISMPFLTLIEKGRRQPSLTVLRDLATALKVPFDALVLVSRRPIGSARIANPVAKRIADSLKKLKSVQIALKQELESYEND
jgi:transcriptional regulator with XRE-family HTH domain